MEITSLTVETGAEIDTISLTLHTPADKVGATSRDQGVVRDAIVDPRFGCAGVVCEEISCVASEDRGGSAGEGVSGTVGAGHARRFGEGGGRAVLVALALGEFSSRFAVTERAS